MTEKQAQEKARNMMQGLYHGISFFDDAEQIVVQSALVRYYMDGDKEYARALDQMNYWREEKKEVASDTGRN